MASLGRDIRAARFDVINALKERSMAMHHSAWYISKYGQNYTHADTIAVANEAWRVADDKAADSAFCFMINLFAYFQSAELMPKFSLDIESEVPGAAFTPIHC